MMPWYIPYILGFLTGAIAFSATARELFFAPFRSERKKKKGRRR